MTSVAIAVGVDSRGPASLYMITDSRITWTDANGYWDRCQKAFISRSSPDIFAYMGDAFFPPAVIRQICEQANHGLFISAIEHAEVRHLAFRKRIQASIREYHSDIIADFSIFHAARESEFMSSKFRLWEIKYYAKSKRWKTIERDIQNWRSTLVVAAGSGGNIVKRFLDERNSGRANGTTRAAIAAFCDALASKRDPNTGGPPQLVGMWRKGAPKQFGFIWNRASYFGGLEIPKNANTTKVRWFNCKFEICDGSTGKRFPSAKVHNL